MPASRITRLRALLTLLAVLAGVGALAADSARAELGWVRSFPALPAGQSLPDGSWQFADGVVEPHSRDLLTVAALNRAHTYLFRMRPGGGPAPAPAALGGAPLAQDATGVVAVAGAPTDAATRVWVRTSTEIAEFDGTLRRLGTLQERHPALAGIDSGQVRWMGADEQTLFLAVGGELVRYDLATATVSWRVALPEGWPLPLFGVLSDGRVVEISSAERTAPDPDLTHRLTTRIWGADGTHATGPSLVGRSNEGYYGGSLVIGPGDTLLRRHAWYSLGTWGFGLIQLDLDDPGFMRVAGYSRTVALPDREHGEACVYDQHPLIASGPRGPVYLISGSDYGDGTPRVDVLDEGGDLRWCVRSDAPDPQFTADPPTAAIGQPVRFDPAASIPDRSFDFGRLPDEIVRWEWDLDGDGRYETDRATDDPVTASFDRQQITSIGLRVTDRYGMRASRRSELVVALEVPRARMTVGPQAPREGETVTFDGTASGGSPSRYEWDLDGDGAFEVDTAAEPVATKRFHRAGTYPVALRITTLAGERDVVAGSVTVVPFAPPTPAPPGGTAPLDPLVVPGETAAPERDDRSAPRLALPRRLRADRRLRAPLGLRCPVGEERCVGTVAVGSREPELFAMAGGATRTLSLTLPAPARRVLRAGRVSRLAFKLVVRDEAGNRRASGAKVRIAPPKRANGAAGGGATPRRGAR